MVDGSGQYFVRQLWLICRGRDVRRVQSVSCVKMVGSPWSIEMGRLRRASGTAATSRPTSQGLQQHRASSQGLAEAIA